MACCGKVNAAPIIVPKCVSCGWQVVIPNNTKELFTEFNVGTYKVSEGNSFYFMDVKLDGTMSKTFFPFQSGTWKFENNVLHFNWPDWGVETFSPESQVKLVCTLSGGSLRPDLILERTCCSNVKCSEKIK